MIPERHGTSMNKVTSGAAITFGFIESLLELYLETFELRLTSESPFEHHRHCHVIVIVIVMANNLALSITKAVTIRPQRYEEFHSGTVRYGIFAKSRYTGIFRYGISLTFSSQDFLEIVRKFSFFLYWCRIVINLKSFQNCLGFCIYASCPRTNFVIKINIIIIGEK